MLAFALDGHFSPKDGLDSVGRVDVALMGILVLFVLVIFILALLLSLVCAFSFLLLDLGLVFRFLRSRERRAMPSAQSPGNPSSPPSL